MKIGILGSGAIGLLFASRLTLAGADPLCLTRSPAAADGLRAGVHLAYATPQASANATATRETVPLRATTQPADLATCDVVLICVKAYQAEAAAANLAAAWASLPADGPPLPLLLSLMNGLEAEAPFRRLLPAANVAVAVTYAGAARLGPANLRVAGLGPSLLPVLAPPADDLIAQLAALLNAAGLPTELAADSRRQQWTKAIVNAVINPLAALAGIRNGLVPAQAGFAQQAEAIIDEAIAVAAAEGLSVPAAPLCDKVRQTCQATADNECSLLTDLKAGRPTEIDWLNGAIARLARRHGLAAPVNEALWQAIKGRSGGQPES
ncbi:MAG TPA: hypothetical protein DCX65_11095 [Spirochaetaceae bacterium]|nr:hypothetical protein [Spirochaetaceae bacterium]